MSCGAHRAIGYPSAHGVDPSTTLLMAGCKTLGGYGGRETDELVRGFWQPVQFDLRRLAPSFGYLGRVVERRIAFADEHQRGPKTAKRRRGATAAPAGAQQRSSPA